MSDFYGVLERPSEPEGPLWVLKGGLGRAELVRTLVARSATPE